jgi:hypothetical protein
VAVFSRQPIKSVRQVVRAGVELLAHDSNKKKSKTTQKEDTMAQTSATQRGGVQAADKNAIRPFHVISGSGTYRIAEAHQRNKVA